MMRFAGSWLSVREPLHAVTTSLGETEELISSLVTGESFLDLPLEEKRKHPCDFANGK